MGTVGRKSSNTSGLKTNHRLTFGDSAKIITEDIIFYVLLTVHLRIILVINQLNAQILVL